MTIFLAVVALVFLVGTVVFIVFSPTPGTLPPPLTLGVLSFVALEWLLALGIAVAFAVGRGVQDGPSLTFPIGSYLSVAALRLRRFESVGCFAGEGYHKAFSKVRSGCCRRRRWMVRWRIPHTIRSRNISLELCRTLSTLRFCEVRLRRQRRTRSLFDVSC